MCEEIPTWEQGPLLGRGGQAEVYRVRRAGASGPDFARKRLTDLSRADRFAREVETMRRLAREIPGIPVIFETGVMGRKAHPYYVMPCYQGNLDSMVTGTAAPTLSTRLKMLVKIAVVLHSVHEAGVAHRDLKPENILIDDDEQPLLADFGLCLDVPQDDEPQERTTEEWRAVGSRLFIAPEMETGLNVAQDHRPADFWSFGKIIWTTLTGKGPRSAGDQLLPENRLANLDGRFGRLDQLCEQLLRRDPFERLDDWRTVLTELRSTSDALTDRATVVSAPAGGPLDLAREAARRFRSSVPAISDEELRARRKRDQMNLAALSDAFHRGLRTRDSMLERLSADLGGAGSVHSSQGGNSLTDMAVYGVFDELLPRTAMGLPDRAQVVGSSNAVGIVLVSVDADEATYAALGVWLLKQDQKVFAVRIPFVAGPPGQVFGLLIPPVLTPRFLHIHPPVRLGLQSAVDDMERAGEQLADAALDFIAHALAIAARGQPIYSADAWAEQLE